jgi:hypothetical protein
MSCNIYLLKWFLKYDVDTLLIVFKPNILWFFFFNDNNSNLITPLFFYKHISLFQCRDRYYKAKTIRDKT